LKIGQHLVKLWARVGCPAFLTHGVEYCSCTDRLHSNCNRL